MAALRAVKPDIVIPKKPQMLVSGKSGAGKTTWALMFPKPYLIDTEGGATREQYVQKLKSAGGAYFGKEQGSQDFSAVIQEIKTLTTTKHEFKTLIIDSFSKLYNIAAAIAEEQVGSDFGKDKKEANKPTRQLMRWLEKIDMNVLLVCHYVDKWEKRGKEIINIGGTFDGWAKMEYDLDLWLEIQKVGKQRNLLVKKSRIDAFPEGELFPFDFEKFSELYGKDVIQKEVTTVPLASPETVAEIKRLVTIMNISQEEQAGWLKKADVDSYEDLPQEQGDKLLEFLVKKLQPVKGGRS